MIFYFGIELEGPLLVKHQRPVFPTAMASPSNAPRPLRTKAPTGAVGTYPPPTKALGAAPALGIWMLGADPLVRHKDGEHPCREASHRVDRRLQVK